MINEPADSPVPTERPRGPMDDGFECGYVPGDEPPGIEEREYRKWLAAGGKVLQSPGEKNPAARNPQPGEQLFAGMLNRLDGIKDRMAAVESESDRRHNRMLIAASVLGGLALKDYQYSPPQAAGIAVSWADALLAELARPVKT